jgi:hypothetical protein
VHVLLGDEGDGGSAEPGTGHAGAKGTCAEGHVDRKVELGAADGVVVAQRGMACGEQCPCLDPVTAGDRAGELLDAEALGDHMGGTR